MEEKRERKNERERQTDRERERERKGSVCERVVFAWDCLCSRVGQPRLRCQRTVRLSYSGTLLNTLMTHTHTDTHTYTYTHTHTHTLSLSLPWMVIRTPAHNIHLTRRAVITVTSPVAPEPPGLCGRVVRAHRGSVPSATKPRRPENYRRYISESQCCTG